MADPQPMDPTSGDTSTASVPITRRECYAMTTLLAEVRALFPETLYDIEGYTNWGVAMSVSFHTEGQPLLGDLLHAVEVDERVLSVTEGSDLGDPQVLVTFVASPHLQDSRESFRLAAAHAVLADTEEDGA